MLASLSRIRKALVAGVLAGGPLTLAALTPTTPGGSGFATSEVIAILVTTAVAVAGVYSVPNS